MTRRPGPGHVEQLAEAVLALDPPLGDQERRMAVALYAALAEGAAVPAAAVAARAQVPVARVSAWLERLPAVGLVELDRHGRVTAFGGLSLDETPTGWTSVAAASTRGAPGTRCSSSRCSARPGGSRPAARRRGLASPCSSSRMAACGPAPCSWGW